MVSSFGLQPLGVSGRVIEIPERPRHPRKVTPNSCRRQQPQAGKHRASKARRAPKAALKTSLTLSSMAVVATGFAVGSGALSLSADGAGLVEHDPRRPGRSGGRHRLTALSAATGAQTAARGRRGRGGSHAGAGDPLRQPGQGRPAEEGHALAGRRQHHVPHRGPLRRGPARHRAGPARRRSAGTPTSSAASTRCGSASRTGTRTPTTRTPRPTASRRPCPAPRWPRPAPTGRPTRSPRSAGASATSRTATAPRAAPGATARATAGTEPARRLAPRTPSRGRRTRAASRRRAAVQSTSSSERAQVGERGVAVREDRRVSTSWRVTVVEVAAQGLPRRSRC